MDSDANLTLARCFASLDDPRLMRSQLHSTQSAQKRTFLSGQNRTLLSGQNRTLLNGLYKRSVI
jgi:hypothetical protein